MEVAILQQQLEFFRCAEAVPENCTAKVRIPRTQTVKEGIECTTSLVAHVILRLAAVDPSCVKIQDTLPQFVVLHMLLLELIL